MSVNYFTFAGKDSKDFKCYISGRGTFSAPARNYEMISIPGRDGDIVGFEKRLENSSASYPAFIYEDFRTNLRDLRSFLLSKRGYYRLTDTYHPDEFRKAVYRGGLEPEVMTNNKAGSFEIVFECQPQRYLTSGETKTTFTADGSINNPTYFPAAPLLRVYGAGTLGIGSESVIISAVDEYVDIDCEIMEAYKGTVSCNANVTVSGSDFPKLQPGNNGIDLSGSITKVEIYPRWFML